MCPVRPRWEPRGGKSASFFAKTRDDRFIVKQLSAAERRSFGEVAPNYFAYLGRAMRERRPTCLAKIMGVYTVRVPLLARCAHSGSSSCMLHWPLGPSGKSRECPCVVSKSPPKKSGTSLTVRLLATQHMRCVCSSADSACQTKPPSTCLALSS